LKAEEKQKYLEKELEEDLLALWDKIIIKKQRDKTRLKEAGL